MNFNSIDSTIRTISKQSGVSYSAVRRTILENTIPTKACADKMISALQSMGISIEATDLYAGCAFSRSPFLVAIRSLSENQRNRKISNGKTKRRKN